MARNRGTFDFTSNFELLTRAPLDARMVVETYAELILPVTWETDGQDWLFNGALVAVTEDTSELNGVYYLSDYTDYTNADVWIKLNTGNVSINGAINIADPSDGVQFPIYNGMDTSGNLTFRDIGAASGITLDENLGTVWITTDASYSGQANVGANIGTGDVSIYQGKSGDILNFKTLSGSDKIALTQDEYGITIDVSGNVEGISGGVYATNVVADGPGATEVTERSNNNIVVEKFKTDTDLVTISVLSITGTSNFVPEVFLEGTPIVMSGSSASTIWNGSIDVDLTALPDPNLIELTHIDGTSRTLEVEYELPPIILDASFSGTYPGAQTEIKSGQTHTLNFTTDVSVQSVTINSYGLRSGETTISLTPGTEHSISFPLNNTYANAAGGQLYGFSIFVTKENSSSVSEDWISDDTEPQVEFENTLLVNNIKPSVSFGAITYPAGQGALKDTESATVANTVSNFDALQYTSPNSDLLIGSTSDYEPAKGVNRLITASGYNISTANIRLEASRTANNTTASATAVVRIAETPATLSITSQPTRFISAGNDGTGGPGGVGTGYEGTVTATASQLLLGTLSIAADPSFDYWKVSEVFTGSGTSFSNTMIVHDDDPKGVGTYGIMTGVTNLAGLPVTFTPINYTIGGFVSRTIDVGNQMFGETTDINVAITDYNKLPSTLNWSFKQMTIKSSVGDTAQYQALTWAADALDTNPSTIRILDTNALNSNTGAGGQSTLTISESA